MGIRYDFLSKINDEGRLAFLFNKIIEHLNITRIISAPQTFSGLNERHGCDLFYSTCLWEMYLHGVVSRLKSWIESLEEYETEYSSSWKYYAASRRLDFIKKYGGEEEDYNEDGSIRTIGVSDKELESYSILSVLVFNDWRDIVQETSPTDLSGLIAALQTDASFSTSDIVKEGLGIDLPFYKIDENGDMVKATFADNVLQKAVKGNTADYLSSALLYICNEMQSIIQSIRSMDKAKDNKEELFEIKKRIESLYNFQCTINKLG